MLHSILIVEDDNEIGELLEKYLKSNGYETDRAVNGVDLDIEKGDFVTWKASVIDNLARRI